MPINFDSFTSNIVEIPVSLSGQCVLYENDLNFLANYIPFSVQCYFFETVEAVGNKIVHSVIENETVSVLLSVKK